MIQKYELVLGVNVRCTDTGKVLTVTGIRHNGIDHDGTYYPWDSIEGIPFRPSRVKGAVKYDNKELEDYYHADGNIFHKDSEYVGLSGENRGYISLTTRRQAMHLHTVQKYYLEVYGQPLPLKDEYEK